MQNPFSVNSEEKNTLVRAYIEVLKGDRAPFKKDFGRNYRIICGGFNSTRYICVLEKQKKLFFKEYKEVADDCNESSEPWEWPKIIQEREGEIVFGAINKNSVLIYKYTKGIGLRIIYKEDLDGLKQKFLNKK